MDALDPQREMRRQEYTARINRVIDYIDDNLDGDLRLPTLAEVAGFSPFHFHRVFKVMVGETLNDYIRRIRIETAASKLINNPKLTITAVALDCGYSSSAAFAREFRRFFGMSASEFRRGGHERWRKIRKAERKMYTGVRKNREAEVPDGTYTGDIQSNQHRRSSVKVTFEMKELPQRHVAYIRHVGAYNKIGEAFDTLMKWAGPRGIIDPATTKWLAVYHDSPEITEESKLRSDACITVPEGTPVEGEVGTMTIPGGQFAVGHFEIDGDQYVEAWDKLIGEYLPESGYQPDDRLCYELYLNNADEHPEKKHIVDICEPVRPL